MSHTVKLETYQPSKKPSEEYCQTLRDFARKAVFGYWHERHKPIHLSLVEKKVLHELWAIKQNNPKRFKEVFGAKYPSKRTIERRIQEEASVNYASDGVPKIVNVTAGYYKPNPVLFEKLGKKET